LSPRDLHKHTASQTLFAPYENPLDDHSVHIEKAQCTQEVANIDNKKGGRRGRTQDIEAQLQEKRHIKRQRRELNAEIESKGEERQWNSAWGRARKKGFEGLG
jgi:phage terminase small subunit